MISNHFIQRLSLESKHLICLFLCVLAFGAFINFSIILDYIFSENQHPYFRSYMITLQMLSASITFFILALFIKGCSIKHWLKKILLFESLLAVLITFIACYLLKQGVPLMRPIAYLGVLLMATSLIICISSILYSAYIRTFIK